MTLTVKPNPARGARPTQWIASVVVAVAVIAIGVLVGALASGMTPQRALDVAVLLAVGAAVLAAILMRPEIGALATLVVVAVVPIDTLFTYDLRFMTGGLKVTDLLLVACLGRWIAGHLIDPHPLRLPSRHVTLLVVGFVALGFVGVLTARTNGVQLKFALLELRAVLSLLLVFPVVDGVRRIRDLEVGLVLFLVACAVSAYVIARDFIVGNAGPALFSDEATRVNNLIYVYPLAGLIWVFALMPWVRDRRRWLLYLLAAITAAALFFTARRGGWIVALVAPAAVLALVPRARRRGFAGVLVGVVVVGIIGVVGINAVSEHPIESPLTTARDRLFSVNQGDADISSGHRLAEFRAARTRIQDAPFTGIGLGNSITFVSPLYNPAYLLSDVPTTSFYVHDSYLWVALKMGLVALAVFLAMLVAVTWDAWTGYRAASDPRSQRLMLGGLITIVALVGISFTEPHITYVGTAPLFAMAVALTQVVPQLHDDRDPAPEPA
jgi:O-antigen ligase